MSQELAQKMRTSLENENYPFEGLPATGYNNLIYGVDGKIVKRLTSPQMISRIFESRMSKNEQERRARQNKPTSIKEVLVKNMINPLLDGQKIPFDSLPPKVLREINEIILLDTDPGNTVDLIMDEMIQLKINRTFKESYFGGLARFKYHLTKEVNDFDWKQLKKLSSGKIAAQKFRSGLMPLLLKATKNATEEAKIKEYEKEIEELIKKAQLEN